MGWQDAPIVEQQTAVQPAWMQAPIVGQEHEQTMLQPHEPLQGPPMPVSHQQRQPPAPQPNFQPMENPVVGAGEAALQMGTGLASSAAGGLVGLGTLATGGGLGKAGERIQNIQHAGTYQPRTQTGQLAGQAAAAPFELATEGWGMIGEQVAGDEGKLVGEVGFQAAAILAGKPWKLGKPKPATEAGLTADLSRVVKRGVDKGIKPTLAGKNTAHQIDKFYKGASEGVKSIAKNKKTLKYTDEYGEITSGTVPKNLSEFSQAIDQRMKAVFEKYNTRQQEAQGAGASVDLAPVAAELELVASNPVMLDLAPTAASYAAKRMASLQERGSYTPAAAQEAIAVLNDSLKAFYKNPSSETASRAGIDALVANQMRRSLDAIIESSTEGGYQAMKREYGALKSIEKDVNRRMLIDARKAGASTLNFYDVFSAHDLIGGALTGNVMQATKGGFLGMISSTIKRAKDPNRAVKKMFKEADPIVQKLETLISEKEVGVLLAEIEQLQLEAPTNQLALPPGASPAIPQGMGPTTPMPMGRGPKPIGEGLNQLALPQPQAIPAEISAFERMFQIAQSPEGKRLLVERLGREAKHAKLVSELLKVPEQKALPPGQTSGLLPPGQEFQLHGNPGAPAQLNKLKTKSRNALLGDQ